MPFDPSKYVFQPRPLQAFDLGAGYRDLAETRMKNRQLAENERQARASLGEQQAQRQDTNSLNSATFAKDRVNNEYDAANKRFGDLSKLVEQARAAGNANDTATVEALGPSILEMGGTYRKETGPDGSVNYVLEAGSAPSRGQPDVQGARSSIFGGGGPARQSAPFSMPGLGKPPTSSPLLTEQNPFDSLPGASAAAVAPPPEAPPMAAPAAPPAAPPPGSAEADLAALEGMGADTTADPEDEAPPTAPLGTPPIAPLPADAAPTEEEPEDGEEPPPDELAEEPAAAAPSEPTAPSDPALATLDPESAAMAARIESQLGPQTPAAPAQSAPSAGAPAAPGAAPGGNPFSPPAFSPYRLNMADVVKRNQEQNQPLQQALEEGAPVGFRGRAEAFNRNVNRAGMSPDRTKALAGPLLDKLTDMYRTEVGADLAGQRLGNTRDRQAQLASQKNSDTFFKHKTAAYNAAFKTTGLADVKTLNTKQRAARDVEDLVKQAGSNGQAAYQLIGKLHDMADKGIMTKDDYSQATQGQVSWLTAFLRGAERKLIQEKGLDPDSIADIVAVAKAASKRLRQETYSAMEKVYSQYKATRDPAEKAGYAQAMRGTFDEEYLPEDVRNQSMEYEEPESYSPGARGQSMPPSGESLGRTELPRTLDGKPKGSYNGTPLGRGKNVPEKPPKKPVTAAERAKALLRK